MSGGRHRRAAWWSRCRPAASGSSACSAAAPPRRAALRGVRRLTLPKCTRCVASLCEAAYDCNMCSTQLSGYNRVRRGAATGRAAPTFLPWPAFFHKFTVHPWRRSWRRHGTAFAAANSLHSGRLACGPSTTRRLACRSALTRLQRPPGNLEGSAAARRCSSTACSCSRPPHPACSSCRAPSCDAGVEQQRGGRGAAALRYQWAAGRRGGAGGSRQASAAA